MSLTLDQLHWAHLGAAVAHGVQAGYAFVMTNGKYKDQGQFTLTNQVIRPQLENTTDVTTFRLGNLVGAFPALSTCNHLWAFFDRTRYESYVAKGYNPVRWAEYSVSATIMFWVISLLSSQSDVKALTSQGLANMAMQYVGYLIEQQTASGQYQTAVHLQSVGFLVFAAIWLPIMTAFFTSLSTEGNPGEEKPNAIIWSIIFVMTALMLSFAVLSIMYMRSAATTLQTPPAWTVVKDFKSVELGYLVLSFVSKTFLTNMTLFGALFSSA